MLVGPAWRRIFYMNTETLSILTVAAANTWHKATAKAVLGCVLPFRWFAGCPWEGICPKWVDLPIAQAWTTSARRAWRRPRHTCLWHGQTCLSLVRSHRRRLQWMRSWRRWGSQRASGLLMWHYLRELIGGRSWSATSQRCRQCSRRRGWRGCLRNSGGGLTSSPRAASQSSRSSHRGCFSQTCTTAWTQSCWTSVRPRTTNMRGKKAGWNACDRHSQTTESFPTVAPKAWGWRWKTPQRTISAALSILSTPSEEAQLTRGLRILFVARPRPSRSSAVGCAFSPGPTRFLAVSFVR